VCISLKQDGGSQVESVKKDIQSWVRNFSQDDLEGLAKIEMIHDKTFQDIGVLSILSQGKKYSLR
jgi:hypothetical protein